MRVVIAEKPSVAASSPPSSAPRRGGTGYFEGGGYQVTWALGHLVTLKEPQDYDPALKTLVAGDAPLRPRALRAEAPGRAARPRATGHRPAPVPVGRRADLRHGRRPRGGADLPLHPGADRLRRHAGPAALAQLADEAAIRDAFGRLRPLSDYDALYAAARCRSEADWVVGLNATRYYTVRHRSGGILWSVGRVQTPVLALIVRRDDEIRTFTPEPFWELRTRYRAVTFTFAGDRFAKEEDAQELLRRVQGHPFVIRGVDRKPQRELPPQLYDLTGLQRDMNRRFGLSADATLKAAQALYEAKLITYPRTDSRHLGGDMKAKVPGILDDLGP
jgi:DNA topoisomerase-3